MPDRVLAPPAAILRLGDVTICTEGNISNIQGPAKSAKSAVMGAAIAAVLRALLGKPECPRETLGFTSKLPPNRAGREKIVLHFDTEQSAFHHHKLCMDILARAGVTREERKNLPFHSYPMVATDYKMRRKLIAALMKEHPAESGRKPALACVFLDGVADVVSDPNNYEECADLVHWLHEQAYAERIAIVTVLHENPGDSGKARGHLGSQIQRKSETNLRVRKGGSKARDGVKSQDDGVSVVWVERARGGHIREADGIRIRWCESEKRHTVVAPAENPPSVPSGKAKGRKSKAASPASGEQREKEWLETRALQQPQKRKDFLRAIMGKLRCSEGTARNRINLWLERNWIHKVPGSRGAPYAFGPPPAAEDQTS